MTFAARDFSARRGASDEHIPKWICEDAPSSRLATGQIGRNERHRIYAHDHLASKPKEPNFHEPTIVSLNYGGWRGGNGFCPARLGRAETESAQSDYVFHNRREGLGAREVPRHEISGI